MRILISAFACRPNTGSEPGVGWNWALQAAVDHDVWVLTSEDNREAIEQEVDDNRYPRLRFAYHDLKYWKKEWRTGYLRHNLYYRFWQLAAIPLVRRLHRDVGFDIGHQVTYVSFRHPSCLAAIDIPFIWGPIGGGELVPPRFFHTFGVQGALREVFRAVNVWVSRFDPAVIFTAMRASVILGATLQTRAVLPRWARRKVEVVPAIAIHRVHQDQSRSGKETDGLRLLYVGQLIYWKGAAIAIRALALAIEEVLDRRITLTLAGSGPCFDTLMRLAHDLDVAGNVRFLGQIPSSAMDDLYAGHDVLVFPSFADSGGFAVIEAMSAGLPVICLDLGGPALSVTDDVGIRVVPRSPKQVVADLASAISRLAGDRALTRRMGTAAKGRVHEYYTWDSRGRYIRSLYHRVLRTKMTYGGTDV